MRVKSLKIFLFIFMIASNIYSEDNTGHKFILIGSGARAISLGEAYVGIPGDVSSMDYNPAALGFINNQQLSVMHIEYLADMQYEYLSYAFKLKNITGAGVSFKYLHYPAFEQIDSAGNSVGQLNGGDWALTLGAGRKINFLKNSYSGLNLKIINSSLGDYNAFSIAFDIGIMKENYLFQKNRIITGLSFRNLGFNLKSYRGNPTSLPIEGAFGSSIDLLNLKVHKILGSFEVISDFKSSPKIHTGIEYSFNNFIFIRGGYKFGYSTSEFSVGAGIKRNLRDVIIMKKYHLDMIGNIDYALVPYKELGINHYISLNIQFASLK